MDTHRGSPHRQSGRVRALYNRLEALVSELPPTRQEALVKQLEADVSLSTDLRQAIENSGQSLYFIARETGIDHAVLGRFVRGERDLRLTTAEKLSDYFRMRLTKPKKPTT